MTGNFDICNELYLFLPYYVMNRMGRNVDNFPYQHTFRGHLEDIYDICWSADGKYMISGSVDNSAILWDLTKGMDNSIHYQQRSFSCPKNHKCSLRIICSTHLFTSHGPRISVFHIDWESTCGRYRATVLSFNYGNSDEHCVKLRT